MSKFMNGRCTHVKKYAMKRLGNMRKIYLFFYKSKTHYAYEFHSYLIINNPIPETLIFETGGSFEMVRMELKKII